ncbi:MAG TPA: SigE family RNA polymerase sigma factor [Frankiaceae bacterium]|nr:SigE family RNA polymerase sigma factor [Frankiaceae bacterium]
MSALPIDVSTASLAVAVPDFAVYVRERGAGLLHVAYLLTGDPRTAEDVVQTALARVFPRWDRLDHTAGNAHGYVLRTLVNCGRSSWRRNRREGIPVAELPDRAGTEGTGEVIDRHVLVAALRQLPSRQRAALVLRYLEDMSEAQTADVMRCSAGSVKTHTSRGLKALRALLADDHRDVPASEGRDR